MKSKILNSINELRKNYSPPKTLIQRSPRPAMSSPRKAPPRSVTNSITNSDSGSVGSSSKGSSTNSLDFLSNLSGSSISLVALGFVTAVMAYRVAIKAAFYGSVEVMGDAFFGGETLVVDASTGNVGIRTQTPEKNFVVNGDSLFNGDLTIGTTRFVATASLNRQANVEGSLTIVGDVEIDGDLMAKRVRAQESDTTEKYTINGETVLTRTSLGESVVNSNLENVGILERLDVRNDLTVGTADFVVNTDLGRVGINTDEPGQTLDVQGTVLVSDTLFIPSIEATSTTLNLGCGSPTNIINIGVSDTNPKIINIGSSNGFVNIHGSVFSSQATNLEVTDKTITLNKASLEGSSGGAGFEVEEGGANTAYIKINHARDSWLVKAPESQEGGLVTTVGPQFVSAGVDLYYTSGNIGIGTTLASGARLHVGNGNIRVDNEYAYVVGTTSVLDRTTLGNTVVNSSLQTVGDLTHLTVDGEFVTKSTISMTNAPIGNGIPLAIDPNGRIVKVASSRRYKKNIQNLSDVADSEEMLARIVPRAYEYVSSPGEIIYGMIAEELEAVNQNFVSYTPEGRVEGIQYFQLIPFLIAEVKKIPDLRSEIVSLKDQIEKLKSVIMNVSLPISQS